MDELYLSPTHGAKWIISRWVFCKWISLHQDSYLYDPNDAVAVLRALDISPTIEALDQYFPIREKMGRCPTLELMELCNVLDPTNPMNKKGEIEPGV